MKYLLIFSFFFTNFYKVYGKENEPEPKDKNSSRLELSWNTEYNTEMGVDLSYSIINGYHYLTKTLSEKFNVLITILNLPFARFFYIVNHELGHFLRIKQIKDIIGDVKLTVKVGFSSGEVDIENPEILENTELFPSVSLGGIHASKIFCEKIIINELLDEKISPFFSLVYIFSATDQYYYIKGVREYEFMQIPCKEAVKSENYKTMYKSNLYHDIESYAYQMRDLYGVNYRDVIGDLLKYAWIDFLDPIILYSAFSVITNRSFKAWMIPIGDNIKYLPAFSFTLSPFGYSIDYINYIFVNKILLKVIFNFGNAHIGNRYYAMSAYVPQIYINEYWSIGIDFSLWYQPPAYVIETKKPKIKTENKFGGLLACELLYKFSNELGLTSKIGYKTSGFSMKYSPRSSFIISLGVNYTY